MRWFGQAQRSVIDATVKKSDALKVIDTSRRRGRPNKTWKETVRRCHKALNYHNLWIG